MSKTYLETMGLHNIDSIDITDSNLGHGINDRFENIGYNFNKILKSEYLRGHSGSNMSTVTCKISDSTDIKEDVFYSFKSNITHKLEWANITEFNIKTMIGDKLRSHYGDVIDSGWLNRLFSNDSTIYFITENDSYGNKYIKASLPYHIVDPDLVSKYKALYNVNTEATAVGFVDKSCVIYFDTQNDGCLDVKIYDNIPTIYYDTVVKDFCWKINGERTGISAKGIPGQQGLKGSSFLLGLFTYSENKPVNGRNELSRIYMVNNNGDGQWYNVNDSGDMLALSEITSLDNGSPIIAIGLTENTTQSSEPTTKVVLGVLHVSTGAAGTQYHIAYDNGNMDIGSIISRADYFESLSDSDSLFLNSRDDDDNIAKVTVDSGEYKLEYKLGHFIKPSIDSGKHVLSMGLNMYGSTEDDNTKIPTSIMGANELYVGEIPNAGDKGITSSLDINYDELNLNGNLKAQNIIAEGSITAQNIDIAALGGITSQNIVTNDIKATGDLEANTIKASKNGSIGVDLFVGGRIGNTTSKTPLNVNDGIYIYNTKVSPEKMPVQMWQPDDVKRRYEVGFYSSRVGLYDSCLNVTGYDETNNDIGIYSRYDIKTGNRLISENGINVDVKSTDPTDRQIKLSGPVELGKFWYDQHQVRGDLTILGSTRTTELNIGTETYTALTASAHTQKVDIYIPTNINNDLNVTGKTEVNNLTVNGSITVKGETNVSTETHMVNNTTIGNGKGSKLTIKGEIIIEDWIADDSMIEKIFI